MKMWNIQAGGPIFGPEKNEGHILWGFPGLKAGAEQGGHFSVLVNNII